MKYPEKVLKAVCMALMMVGIFLAPAAASMKVGVIAPVFTLKDTGGVSHDLASMKRNPMVILYFFDADSRSSIEGLVSLSQLMDQHKEADIKVWALTASSRKKVAAFQKTTKTQFPVMLDTKGISKRYKANQILPTICILGPELKLLDYFQGGGKTTEVMLLRLAERQLHRKKTSMARAITRKVEKKDPGNIKAKQIKGYAALQEGKLDEAEQTFYALSRKKGKGTSLGKEGLVTVYAKKGQAQKSMDMAGELEKAGGSPSALAHVVKGDLLYRQKKKKEAESEYRKATQKISIGRFHKATAYNRLGMMYADTGKLKKSRELYDRAVAIDPYYIEATSNKGMAYEKEGKWEKALESYLQAQEIDSNDPFASLLAENARSMILLDQDASRKNALMADVKQIARRYRNGTEDISNLEDAWTSRPTVVALFGIEETGGIYDRDGFSTMISSLLAKQLNASGRIKVVDRYLTKLVLDELGIDQGQLGDKSVLKGLTRAFGATMIITGTVHHLPGGPLCNLKLMDAKDIETAEKGITRHFTSISYIKNDLFQLNRQLLTTIIKTYPLKAFVVQVTGYQVLVNLGAKQGVVEGSKFNIVEEKPPIVYKGKSFTPEPGVIAQVNIVKTDPDFSYGHIKNQRRPIKNDDKLMENTDELSIPGEKNKIW